MSNTHHLVCRVARPALHLPGLVRQLHPTVGAVEVVGAVGVSTPTQRCPVAHYTEKMSQWNDFLCMIFFFTILYIDYCLILFVNFNKIFIVIYSIFAVCHHWRIFFFFFFFNCGLVWWLLIIKMDSLSTLVLTFLLKSQ